MTSWQENTLVKTETFGELVDVDVMLCMSSFYILHDSTHDTNIRILIQIELSIRFKIIYLASSPRHLIVFIRAKILRTQLSRERENILAPIFNGHYPVSQVLFKYL